KSEGNDLLPDSYGDLGLTAQFLAHVSPAQAIICGTSSFRLDKLALYLSASGPEAYFKDGLGVEYDDKDARRFADEILEEVLGIYQPPRAAYRDHDQYVTAALRMEVNRKRADEVYLDLLQQIGKLWGTLLALRGYSRGESFVARNVGLKSRWEKGQWKVRIIFMDHDALAMPGSDVEKFYPPGALGNMTFDESYIWDRTSHKRFVRSEVGCLQSIYRIENRDEGYTLTRLAIKQAYRRTQQAMVANARLRTSFHKSFIDKLLVWDTMVSGYFRLNGNKAESAAWKKEMKQMLLKKGYRSGTFEAKIEAIKQHAAFLERNLDLFDHES
ncbi:MAG TPA: hypothetical protein VI756_28760, partial [Blastocatellia bacterium]